MAQRAELIRSHIAERQTLRAEWSSHRDRFACLTTGCCRWQGRTTATLNSYRSGTVSLVSVVDARRNEIDIAMQRLDIEASRHELGHNCAICYQMAVRLNTQTRSAQSEKKSSQIKIGLVIAGASLLTGGAWWIGLNQRARMVNQPQRRVAP